MSKKDLMSEIITKLLELIEKLLDLYQRILESEKETTLGKINLVGMVSVGVALILALPLIAMASISFNIFNIFCYFFAFFIFSGCIAETFHRR